MDETFWLTKEIFFKMAEASGLDTKDPHMEDLYAFVLGILPGLKILEELDLTGIEPALPPCSETVSPFATRPSTDSGRTAK